MDRAALPVFLAAGVSATGGMLTCPDLISALERAGRPVWENGTKQKWDCDYQAEFEVLIGWVHSFIFMPGS